MIDGASAARARRDRSRRWSRRREKIHGRCRDGRSRSPGRPGLVQLAARPREARDAGTRNCGRRSRRGGSGTTSGEAAAAAGAAGAPPAGGAHVAGRAPPAGPIRRRVRARALRLADEGGGAARVQGRRRRARRAARGVGEDGGRDALRAAVRRPQVRAGLGRRAAPLPLRRRPPGGAPAAHAPRDGPPARAVAPLPHDQEDGRGDAGGRPRLRRLGAAARPPPLPADPRLPRRLPRRHRAHAGGPAARRRDRLRHAVRVRRRHARAHAVEDAVLAGDGRGGARGEGPRRRGADERRDRQALRRRGVRSRQVRRAILAQSCAIRRNSAQLSDRRMLTTTGTTGRSAASNGSRR